MTSSYFWERPAGKPSFDSLLSGLLFMEPSWLKLLLGVDPTNPLEGAFWSLYVECKFYFFAALLYFWKGRNWLVFTIFSFFTLSIFCDIGNSLWPGNLFWFANALSENLSFHCFGWFAAGAAFYIYSKTKTPKWFFTALCFALISAIFVRNLEWQPALIAGSIVVFFALSIISPHLQAILSNRFLLFFGFISYPLYLIHENMMISMIVKLGRGNLGVPDYLYPLLTTVILATLAYLIARFGEPYTKQCVVNCCRRFQWDVKAGWIPFCK